MKTTGQRNANHQQAKFWWSKARWQDEPLEMIELEYLDELARLRLQMFDGKVRSEERQEQIEARHDEVIAILANHYLDITVNR